MLVLSRFLDFHFVKKNDIEHGVQTTFEILGTRSPHFISFLVVGIAHSLTLILSELALISVKNLKELI